MRSRTRRGSLPIVDTESFFDEVARTLAESMPRRRAVRVIGVSLAALAVPGIRPARALARTRAQAAACTNGTAPNPFQNVCDKNIYNSDHNVETYCCGPPKWRYGCGDPDKGNCADSCPPRANLGHRVVEQYPCTATKPDAQGQFRGRCCVKPEYNGCSPDGECLPNCPYQYRFGGALGPVSCGKTCCARHQICENGECTTCESRGKQSCTPAKTGSAICCAKGTTCYFNNTTTACCGPKQRGIEQKGKMTCACEKGGTKCGTDCCGKKESCCNGLAKSTCCKPGETCCSGECCSGSAICCDDGCCDPKQGEFCLAKYRLGAGINLTCKKGCSPANKCGPYCCGTGTRCVKGKCVK